MKTQRIALPFFVFQFLLIGSAFGQSSDASLTAGDLLEEGVYLQDAKRDFDGAIRIFERIISDEQENRPIAAEAQYRLAVCQLERGQSLQATQNFERLVDRYPDQERWVDAALKRLPREFEPVLIPWEDGERVLMEFRDTSGDFLGYTRFTIEKSEIEGRSVWKCRHWQKIRSQTGLTTVEIDRETYRPIRGQMFASSLGNARTLYGDGEIRTTYERNGTEISFPLEHRVFDNEQVLYAMRQFPIEVGYKTRLDAFVALSGVTMPVDFEIVGKENMDTPLGEVQTYEVQARFQGILQRYWFTADERRQFVRMAVGNLLAVAIRFDVMDAGRMAAYENKELGYAIEHPGHWHYAKPPGLKSPMLDRVYFFDPDDLADCYMVVKPMEQTGADPLVALNELAEKSLQGNLDNLANCKLIEGSRQELALNGVAARTFIGEYGRGKGVRRYYRGVIHDGQRVYLFTARSKPERFDELLVEFRKIFESIRFGI